MPTQCSGLVPGLKYKRGVSEWHLATKDCSQFFSKYSEVEGTSMQSNMRPYMFPPTEEEAARFNLDRCMRVLPHLQVPTKISSKTSNIPIYWNDI